VSKLGNALSLFTEHIHKDLSCYPVIVPEETTKDILMKTHRAITVNLSILKVVIKYIQIHKIPVSAIPEMRASFLLF